MSRGDRRGMAGAPVGAPWAAVLGWALAGAAILLLGLGAGAHGWDTAAFDVFRAALSGGTGAGGVQGVGGSDSALLSIVRDIRVPRGLGAWLVGALLGLAGAVAQGLFRNPLADPYLLGSASGAALGVAVALVATGTSGASALAADLALRWGLVGAAFAGALAAVGLTLLLAQGVQQTLRLLLAGVVVGVVLAAAREVLALRQPDLLPALQGFMLGATGYLGWPATTTLAWVLGPALAIALSLARLLDGLALGEATARSLGLPLGAGRLVLVAVLALATGAAVAQAGLIAFVGLVAPHLVWRQARGRQAWAIVLATLAGGALLALADALARVWWAPQELPVGVLTALVGGVYLLRSLHRPRHAAPGEGV